MNPDLDDRVRRAFDIIIDAAGDLGPSPTPDGIHLDRAGTGRGSTVSGRRVWHRALGAVAVLVVVVGGLAVLDGRGGHDAVDAPEGSVPLFDTRWYLSTATLDGVPVGATPGRIGWVFGEENPCTFSGPDCDPGPVLVGTDGCNWFERSISVDGDRVTWGEWATSTLALCQSNLQTTFNRVWSADGFTFAIVDDTLHIRVGGAELNFTESEPLGDPSGFPLDTGRAGDIAYRVTWNAGIDIEWVDTSAAAMTNSMGYAATGNTLSGKFVDLSGPRYLFAILPDAAAGAAYIPDNGGPIDLTMLDQDGAPFVAASRLFDSDPGPGRLVALDDAGAVFASIPMIGADQPGITSLPPNDTTASVGTTSPQRP